MNKGEVSSPVITLESTGTGVLAYVYLQEIRSGGAARTEEVQAGSVLADYDAQGRLLGLEFLHAEEASGELLRELARRLSVPQLNGLDLAEMCNAPA
jgi:hypothetical protein